eukprot:g72480.t1
MIEDDNTTVALGRLRKALKRFVKAADEDKIDRNYYRFVFVYRNSSNVVRVLRSTADWIHAPVPRAFQDVLNRNEKALSFFYRKIQAADRGSDKSTNGLISDDDKSVRSDAHANSSKQYLQVAMEAKAEVLALKAKLEAAHSTIKSLCDGDKEANKFFDDTIKLVDDERSAKLAAQSELKQCKQDLAEEQKKVSKMNAAQEKISSPTTWTNPEGVTHAKQVNADLRKEITDYKKQLAEYVENASNDADLETVENKLCEAEANVKQLTTALQKAESNAAKYLEKYNDAKVQLVSVTTQRDILKETRASSKSLPRYRSEASDSPEPRPSLIVTQTTLKQRALIALNINANNHSHHKSSDSEYDCESDYSKTKSPHCSTDIDANIKLKT